MRDKTNWVPGVKISLTDDPMCAKVDLDEKAIRELTLLLALRHLSDLLFEVQYSLQEADVVRAKKYMESFSEHSAHETIGGESFDFWRQFVSDEKVAEAISYLNEPHCGDCICVPCSCARCWMEDLVGLDTTGGLGKHAFRLVPSVLRNGAGKSADDDTDLTSAKRFVQEYQAALEGQQLPDR